MTKPSPLDDPENAAFAWARWKRMMWLMAAVALIVVCAVLAFFYATQPRHPIHFYIAVAGGVGVTILLTGALMGLMFLSNGSGHDESVADSHDEDWR